MKTEYEFLRQMIRVEEQRADAWKAFAMELSEVNRKLLAAPNLKTTNEEPTGDPDER